MTCVRPPLAKKPARGFGWACGPCNVAQEKKLEARNAPHLQHDTSSHAGTEDEEFPEEEEDDAAHNATTGTSPSDEHDHPPPTAEQIKQASLWPYRYLGQHCKIEDALDYDDRIFPRASSRLGPRHQANVDPWPGRPVEYVKPLEIKKSGRKDGRHSKEVQALIEKDKKEREARPKHIQDEPYPGYIPRGEDYPEDDPRSTSTCLWKPAEDEDGEMLKDNDGDMIISEAGIDEYMETARSMWQKLQVPEHSTNLEDVARDLLYKHAYDAEKALKELETTPKEAFKEPDLSPAEQKKFEEAVTKYGSELLLVKRHLKTSNYGMIVRHWYKWKKTPQGKKIWGNYSQRKGKKEVKKAQAEASKAADEVADAHDDSAFDNEKAKVKKKAFMCKFCNTKTSKQWRRAPNVTSATVTDTSSKTKDKGIQYIVALCRRCAELWRRYAIQWEDMDEISKKIALAGGRAWKRKIDEEVVKELVAANEMMEMTNNNTPEPPASTKATAGPSSVASTPLGSQTAGQEPPRKKLKSERDSASVPPDASGAAVPAGKNSKSKDKGQDKDKDKEKAIEKAAPPAPPPPPPMPKPRMMPCDVCGQLEPMGDQRLQCKECRMTVHRNCYGVVDDRPLPRWTCDLCSNDKNPQNSWVSQAPAPVTTNLPLLTQFRTTSVSFVQSNIQSMTLWSRPRFRTRKRRKRNVNANGWRRNWPPRQRHSIASDKWIWADRSTRESRSSARPTTTGCMSRVLSLRQRSSSATPRRWSRARASRRFRGRGSKMCARCAGRRRVDAWPASTAVLPCTSSVRTKLDTFWALTLLQSRALGGTNTAL